ncbi:aldo/keto reductase [Luedemannella flava]
MVTGQPGGRGDPAGVPRARRRRGAVLPAGCRRAQPGRIRPPTPAAHRRGLPTLAEVVRDVARQHGVRPGQVALAWVQQQAEVWQVAVVPIPGTSRIDHLEENVAAAALTLDPAALSRLTTASRPH